MKRALVAALAAALHLAAAVVPCPPPAEREGRAAAAFAAGALHATHGAPGAEACASGELRAPCPCGCGHAAAGGVGSGRLGSFLLQAAPALEPPPVTAALAREAPAFADRAPAAPDPVPRTA